MPFRYTVSMCAISRLFFVPLPRKVARTALPITAGVSSSFVISAGGTISTSPRSALRLLLRRLALANLELVELGLEHREGVGAVAVLRPVVLGRHHDVGRQVRDADCRVGLVDVLAARARGAIRVDAQVRRIDLDFD